MIILGAGVAAKASKVIHLDDIWLELGLVVFATLQLTFDFAAKANDHKLLQLKYAQLLAEMELKPLEEDGDENEWNAKLWTIAGEEPLMMHALNALSFNAALDATESDLDKKAKDRLVVPFCHRLLKNIVARDGYEYRPGSIPWWKRLLSCFMF